jgi:hypothetical protein
MHCALTLLLKNDELTFYLISSLFLQVAAVMKKAATLKVSAKLRQLTKLAVVKENATRWSSTYQMIDRYFKIQMQLSALVELLALLPTPIEVDTLSRGFKCLQKFQDITIMLQRDAIPFTEVRGIFNLLVVDFPEMDFHLGTTSRLVINPDFESGIMRIVKGTPLTAAEQGAVSRLVKMDMAVSLMESESDDEDVSYAVRVAKRLKQEEMETVKREQFVNLDVIPGTSVNCERLFSLAKNILTDTRKCTAPVLFEALLFLKVNRHLWDAYSVGKAMGRSREREERIDGGSANDDSEYNRGGSDDEYGSHVLDEELLYIDDS